MATIKGYLKDIIKENCVLVTMNLVSKIHLNNHKIILRLFIFSCITDMECRSRKTFMTKLP